MQTLCNLMGILLFMVMIFVEACILGKETKKSCSQSLLLPCLLALSVVLVTIVQYQMRLDVMSLPGFKHIFHMGVGGMLVAQLAALSIIQGLLALGWTQYLKMKLSKEKIAKVILPGSAVIILGFYLVQNAGIC